MPNTYPGRPAVISLCVAAAFGAFTAESTAAEPAGSKRALLERVDTLEKRLDDLQRALEETRSQLAAERAKPALSAPPAPAAAQALAGDSVADRLGDIEQRLGAVETNTVLSEPKTSIKEITVYVDDDGNQFDVPTPGATPTVTYQRERVYRRQVLSEEIEDALSNEKKNSIALGINSVTTAQAAFQTAGAKTDADRHVYALSAVDLTLAASSAALNTSFFADLVGVGGSGPSEEIPTINLINGQLARLSNNQVSVREAWVKTELFEKKLSLTAGLVDLTNYFDRNAVANDENSQFLNDALVNNPVLGLTANGLGAVAIYDPKIGLNVKFGFQQSDPQATSLSVGRFVFGEVEYLARPFALPEGHYRLWARQDNSTGQSHTGYGLSINQKVTPAVTLFGRYGRGFVGSVNGDMRFYSAGAGFQAPLTFNPLDTWGVGYANTLIYSGPNQNSERVTEAFYNFKLTGSLWISGLLQYLVTPPSGQNYLLPGVRMQVAF